MADAANNEPPVIQPMSIMPPQRAPQQAQPSAAAEEPTGGARTIRSETTDRQEAKGKPDGQGKPEAAEKDPMRELLDRLERMAPAISDPALARTVQRLSQRGADPDRRAQPGFRHDVAYALQDVEKSLGRLEISPALRAEMTQLAGTAVGLTNERIQALMTATANIQDRALVADIREAGKGLGRRVDQNAPETQSLIEMLENRARLTPRPAGPESTERAGGGREPAGDNRPTNGSPSNPSNEPEGPGSPSGTRSNGPPNGVGIRNGMNNQGQVMVQPSVLDTLLRAMRPPSNQAQPPWEPPATPVADRLAGSERIAQRQSEDRTLAGAERRGRTALEALQGFANGEGAAVMSKIIEAAKTEPGGMPQVLAEMRDGGRFADLRKQFGNALTDDAGFAAAYDRAAGALAAYGKSRTDIEPILARRPDATAFTQRLTEMDAEIGKAAAAAPSKSEGRSMIEDLAKQASELLQRAVDAVRSAFSRAPAAGAASSPSPGP